MAWHSQSDRLLISREVVMQRSEWRSQVAPVPPIAPRPLPLPPAPPPAVISWASCAVPGPLARKVRACCPLACGRCGGVGCDERPGGRSHCCTYLGNSSCNDGPPPCKMPAAAPKITRERLAPIALDTVPIQPGIRPSTLNAGSSTPTNISAVQRQAIRALLYKAHCTDERLVVAAIGSSVLCCTHSAPRIPDVVAELLRSLRPPSAGADRTAVHNGAMGGSNMDYFAMCAKSQLPATGAPDLVLVEDPCTSSVEGASSVLRGLMDGTYLPPGAAPPAVAVFVEDAW